MVKKLHTRPSLVRTTSFPVMKKLKTTTVETIMDSDKKKSRRTLYYKSEGEKRGNKESKHSKAEVDGTSELLKHTSRSVAMYVLNSSISTLCLHEHLSILKSYQCSIHTRICTLYCTCPQ